MMYCTTVYLQCPQLHWDNTLPRSIYLAWSILSLQQGFYLSSHHGPWFAWANLLYIIIHRVSLDKGHDGVWKRFLMNSCCKTIVWVYKQTNRQRTWYPPSFSEKIDTFSYIHILPWWHIMNFFTKKSLLISFCINACLLQKGQCIVSCVMYVI